jgi:hypothetical protein
MHQGASRSVSSENRAQPVRWEQREQCGLSELAISPPLANHLVAREFSGTRQFRSVLLGRFSNFLLERSFRCFTGRSRIDLSRQGLEFGS